MLTGTVDRRKYHDAGVANGASVSAALDLEGRSFLGFVLPAAFTTNTARVQFLVGMAEGSLQLLRGNTGTILTLTVAAAPNTLLRAYLDPVQTRAWRWLQVQLANSSNVAVTQGAARAITAIAYPLGGPMETGLVDLRNHHDASVAIGSGTSTNGADLEGRSLVGIVLPAALDATTARVQFLGSHDGQSYQLIRGNTGTIATLTVAATTNTLLRTHLDPTVFRAWRFVKIQFATTGNAEVNQTAARSVTLISAPVGL